MKIIVEIQCEGEFCEGCQADLEQEFRCHDTRYFCGAFDEDTLHPGDVEDSKRVPRCKQGELEYQKLIQDQEELVKLKKSLGL